MNKPCLLLIVFMLTLGTAVSAQEDCAELALADIDAARTEYSDDVISLFVKFRAIQESFDNCISLHSKSEMTPGEIVDGGHIIEGLWSFTLEYTHSDACEERRKHETHEFFEDVYYDDTGLLVWDAGNNFSNFTFEYSLARRYTASEGNPNWVYEYQITEASDRTLSGTYAAYWQGNRNTWCTVEGTFVGALSDNESACLVEGEANIRVQPSTNAPTNGKVEVQRLAIDKVLGDDSYYWWKLSDDEYVREDVVGASRSCDRL